MISIDESGIFENGERYFILAGIMYKEKDFEEVKNHFVPLCEKISSIIGEKELHCKKMGGNKRNFVRCVMFSHIGNFNKVKSFAYVIDKANTKIITTYDKKSFKYNKALEFFYNDLIKNEIISQIDEVGFLIDDINLNKKELENLRTWLPSNNKKILFVETGDSKAFKFIQMADIIANAFSTNGKCNMKSYYMKILNPFFEIFPKKYRDEYLVE